MAKLILFTILVIYLTGIWKFIKGYNYTNFSRQLPNKLLLCIIWPILIVANSSYRHNFQKALKRRE